MLVSGASSRAGAEALNSPNLSVPILVEPAAGQILTAGAKFVFRVRTQPDDQLFLKVSRSPAAVDACGTIGDDVFPYNLKATSDPSVYATDYFASWTGTPGTYYWQAYRIEYGGGADGCIESEVRSLVIKAAPKPAPPKPKPKPKPRPPGTLVAARLAGSFDVTERYTSVSGIDVKVGSKTTDSWRFVPQCSRGVCSASLTFRYGHASDFLRVPHTQRVRLARSGASYSGSARMAALECGYGNEVTGTLTVKLRVTKGAWIRSSWRATRFAGSARLEAPATSTTTYRCPAARYTTSVSGSLED